MSVNHMSRRSTDHQYNIPAFQPNRHYIDHKKEYDDIIGEVLASENHILGKYTEQLEHEVAQRTNRKYAVAVITGTAALYIAIRAMRHLTKIETPKALSTNYTFAATPETALANRCILTVNDVDDYGHMQLNGNHNDFDLILPVHLFGNCMDYHKMKEFCGNSFVIEDSAQGFGASFDGIPCGSFGDISCLSFDNKKNLASFGQAGMILTNDEKIYSTVKRMRQHGGVNLNNYIGGTNGTIPEIFAATLLHRLNNYFDDEQIRRREIATKYENSFNSLPITRPKIDSHVTCVWQKYVIRHENRDNLIEYLRKKGIQANPAYGYTIDSCDFVEKNSVYSTDSPSSKIWASTSLTLPLYSELTNEEIDSIIDFTKGYLR